jgi:hypothetical protein
MALYHGEEVGGPLCAARRCSGPGPESHTAWLPQFGTAQSSLPSLPCLRRPYSPILPWMWRAFYVPRRLLYPCAYTAAVHCVGGCLTIFYISRCECGLCARCTDQILQGRPEVPSSIVPSFPIFCFAGALRRRMRDEEATIVTMPASIHVATVDAAVSPKWHFANSHSTFVGGIMTA